jgi:hypothetical protein
MNQSWRRSENGVLVDAQEVCRATNTAMVGQEGPRRIEAYNHKPDSFTLVYVDLLQRMVSHTIRLIATALLRPPHSRTTSRSGVIGLPNPLKVLGVTHSEVPDKAESPESVGRIEVDGQAELGVVPLEGTIMANRTVLTNNERRTIFWTESGITVGAPVDDNVY